MFKICNDKTYYVVQTTSEDVVVEIYTKKDGRGSDISLHEMHLDLCRAIRKLQHDGYTIMKVYPAMGDRRESIDVLSMPEFIQSAKCPDNDVEEAVVFSYFESGATFQLPCKVNKETHEFSMSPVQQCRVMTTVSVMQKWKSTARIILSILLTIFLAKTMLMMRWMSFIEFSRQTSIGSLLATKRWMMPFTNVVGRF